MSDVPKVWWVPRDGGFVVTEALLKSPPPDAIPLVPQASRDELREALRDNIRIAACRATDSEVDLITRVAMNVLTDRGLVARPTGQEER